MCKVGSNVVVTGRLDVVVKGGVAIGILITHTITFTITYH